MSTKDYVIADINLASWGRKEIAIAETEMPGLMAIRAEFTKTQPLHEHPRNVTFPSELACCSARSILLKTRCPPASYTSMCSKRVEMQQTYKLSAFSV